MSSSRTSLRTFLLSAKGSLLTVFEKSTPVTFVVGNESADLDSLCSAVFYAYIRTSIPPYRLHIPLSNIVQADLSLRPELNPVLVRASLKPQDLITLSDLPLLPSPSSIGDLAKSNSQNIRFILVDHNSLTGRLATFADRVVGCIDHHEDENSVPVDCGDEPRIITKSGSCSSLVVEYCKDAWLNKSCDSSYPESKRLAEWDAEVAQVALAPILIDTNNLKDASKVTEADKEAVTLLQQIITKVNAIAYNRDEYFKDVTNAKADIGGLSLDEILRKDYKEWGEDGVKIGVSAVVKNMHFLLGKAGSDEKLFSAIHEFSKARSLSVFAMMTMFTNESKEFSRELLVSGINERGTSALKRFEKSFVGELGLRCWERGLLDTIFNSHSRCWNQEKLANSRKQVAPMLRKAVIESS